MKALTKYFIQGSLVLAPLGMTVYVVTWLLSSLSGLQRLGSPFVVLLLALGTIVLVGALIENVIGNSAVQLLERVLERLPLVGLLYRSLRDLLGAFIGDRKGFDRPVAVTVGATSIKVLGFVTRDSLKDPSLAEHVAVYVPQSYNFAGHLLIVPREHVTPLTMSASDTMTLIVSGGVSSRGEKLAPNT